MTRLFSQRVQQLAPDQRRVLRTDHELRLYRALVLRLHYRMESTAAWQVPRGPAVP